MPEIPLSWLDGEPDEPKITDLCLAYQKICELGIAMNLHPANQHPGCLEIRLDDHWQISFNGHQRPMPCAHGHGVKVYPFNAYVRYNGFPAGLITPIGGTIAAGEAANEDTLLAALERANTQRAERLKEAGQIRQKQFLAEILEIVRAHQGLKTNEVAKLSHHERSLTLRLLKELEDEKYVANTGSAKVAMWEAV